MSMADGSTGGEGGAPAKLPFGETLGGTFAIVFDRLWMFIKALIVPLLLGIGFAVIGGVLAEISLPLLLAWQILAMLPLAILGVAYCRLALLGRAAGALPRPLLGRRTWVFFGYALLLGIATLLPVLAILLLVFGDQMTMAPGAVQDPTVAARRGLGLFSLMPFFALVLTYLLTRLSLVFPAVAVDEKLGLRGSWRLTRGRNGLKLYAVLFVLCLLCVNAVFFLMITSSGIFGFFLAQPGVLPENPQDISLIGLLSYLVPTFLLILVLESLFVALMISAIASAYARLSGRRPSAAA